MKNKRDKQFIEAIFVFIGLVILTVAIIISPMIRAMTIQAISTTFNVFVTFGVICSIIAITFIFYQKFVKVQTLESDRQKPSSGMQTSRKLSGGKWESEKKYLLTKPENEFKNYLRNNLSQDYEIHCKVKLTDVLAKEHTKHLNKKSRWYSGILQMHVDFAIICSKTSKIIMVIELDDETHNNDKAKRRDYTKDNTLKMSGVHCERVIHEHALNPNVIQKITDFCK